MNRKQHIIAVLVAVLEKGLEEASAKGWTVVDMKKDWKVVYPSEKK